MKLVISSIDKEKEIENISYVDLPSSNGRLRILDHHDNMVSLLNKGMMKYLANNDIQHELSIEEGIVFVLNNTVNIIITKGDIA